MCDEAWHGRLRLYYGAQEDLTASRAKLSAWEPPDCSLRQTWSVCFCLTGVLGQEGKQPLRGPAGSWESNSRYGLTDLA